MHDDPYRPVPVDNITWKIDRKGRPWREEARARYDLAPAKIELIEGKIFCSERDRLVLLGLLLETVGVDKAIRLGDPEVGRQALAHRDEPMVLDEEEYLGRHM